VALKLPRVSYCPLVGGQCNKEEYEVGTNINTFFIAEPFEPSSERKRREEVVRIALKEALGGDYCENSLEVADKEPKEAIFCDICRMIQFANYGIADISGLNPNVLLELGMMLSLGKPVSVLFKKGEEASLRTKLPSDIVWKRVIPYEEFIDLRQELVNQIRNRPEIKPQVSSIAEMKEVIAKADPSLARAVEASLEKTRKELTAELEKLLTEVKLSGKIPQEKVQIPTSLEKGISELLERVTKLEKLSGFAGNAELSFLKGNWHLNNGENEKALELFDWALTLQPNFDAAWNNKGLALHHLGKYEEALKCYDKAIELNPTDDCSSNNKGNALDALGKYEEALKCYDKAIELSPTDERLWTNKANTLDNLGKYEEALKYADKAIELNPRYNASWNIKGVVNSHLGKREEALKCYDKAIQLNPRDDKSWANKGNALDHLGKYEEALKCYDKAIELNPKNMRTWSSKGAVIYQHLGKYEEATKCYQNAIELDPNYVPALMNLAEVYIDQGDSTRGLDTARSALILVEKAKSPDEEHFKAISLFLCISAYFFKGENSVAQKKIEELEDYLKGLKNFKETSWDFSRFTEAIEQRLKGENKARLLSLIAILKGEK
jgi:tetratricopeptide (TPR) repeat protein